MLTSKRYSSLDGPRSNPPASKSGIRLRGPKTASQSSQIPHASDGGVSAPLSWKILHRVVFSSRRLLTAYYLTDGVFFTHNVFQCFQSFHGSQDADDV